jgi:threonine dehydratase
VEIFISEHAVPAKVEAMRVLGAIIHVVPGGYGEAEAAGKAYAEEQQKTWVSPYNDGQVIAGQGTVGLELSRELSHEKATWLVSVGGGGLLSGIGASIREQAHRPRLIGVQSEASAFMHSLFYRNTQDGTPDLPSLADGLAGAVEHGSVTIPMIKQMADEIVLVSEDEIAYAMAFAWNVYGEKLEGAGAVGLAAVLSDKVKERPAVLIVSGGNVQPEVHAQIVSRFAGETWQ